MSNSQRSDTGLTRPLALRRRRDLEAVPQTFSGRRFWAIKDPVRLRYFHLRDEEYCLFAALDGNVSLAELKDQFERQFAPRRVAIGHIQSFLGTLHQEGLILADAPGQTSELLKRAGVARLRRMGANLSNILAIRFRGFDPQRFIDWLAPHCRWIFTPTAFVAGAALVFAAVLLVVTRFDAVRSRSPDIYSLITPATIAWLSLALALTKILHELGHAVTCRHFGRECHEMGLLILVFTPCVYCNVTDSWMLENKWHRAAIGAAGVFVELVLASLCTFLWWFSEPGLLNTLCFHIMIVCSANTLLLNGNPLLRYDGYFVLADLVEIPNLAQQAGIVVRDWLAALFLGIPREPDDDHGLATRFLLGLYAVVSTIYRLVITVGILWLVHQFLKPHRLGVLTAALAFATIGSMLAVPLWRGWKLGRNSSWNQLMPPRLAAISGSLLLSCLAFFLFVPLPHRVPAPAVIDAGEARQVYVTIPGIVVSTAEAGAPVDEDAPVAVLENVELQLEIARLIGQRDQQQVKLDNLKRRQTSDAAAALIPTAVESLADIEERLAQRLDDERRLVIRAPIAGTVLPVRRRPPRNTSNELEPWSGSPLDLENRGSTLDTGTQLCQIGDPKQFAAWLVLDQRDVEFVKVGQTVRVQLEQSPGRILTGTIQEVAELELQVTPAELLPAGAIPTRRDDAGVPRPVSTAYQARVLLDKTAAPLLLGEIGQAKIHAAPLSLARRLGRYLSHTFRFEI